MESLSSSTRGRVQLQSIKTRIQRFRARNASLLAGTSGIITRNGEKASKAERPRLAFELISREGAGPRGRRASSTGSIIDPAVSTNRTFQASPLSTQDTNVVSEEHYRQRRAWVRLPRKSRKSFWTDRYLSAPGMKTAVARRKIVNCAVSASLLVALLALYLALAITSIADGLEFHTLFILTLMVLTIYFCHSFIRLFMIALREAPEHKAHLECRRISGNWERDVPGLSRRDEEDPLGGDGYTNTGLPPTTIAAPPPAYGIWRGSVKISPDLVYWQSGRRDPAEAGNFRSDRQAAINRPPSYESEGGDRRSAETLFQQQVHYQPQVYDCEESLIHPAERSKM